MTRILGLLLVAVTLSLGSCQCSNKPDVGPVEEEASAGLIGSEGVAIDMNGPAYEPAATVLPGRVVIATVSS